MDNAADTSREAVTEEYKTLRGEIERRSTIQQALFVLNLTAVGALVSIALKPSPAEVSLRETRPYYLTLLIPYVGAALASLWLDHHESIANIGTYIRTTIETRRSASWETALQARYRVFGSPHHNRFFVAYVLAFAGPGVAALVATSPHAWGWGRTPAWLFSLGLVGLNLNGWYRAWRPPSAEAVTFERARTIFEPRVRASLDWTRLAKAAPTVSVFYVDDRSDFQGWFMPWYYVPVGDDSGRIEVQEHEGGLPIRLLDCGRLPAEKTVTVDSFTRAMDHEAPKFDVCIYALPDEKWIILDGNHHLAAALRSGRTFTAHVYEIRGGPSTDPDVLQDLNRDWNANGVLRALTE